MKTTVIALTLLLVGTILLAGCNQSQAPPTSPIPVTSTPSPSSETSTEIPSTPMPDTIMVTANAQYGQILTDMSGITLYYFTKDTPGSGISVCTLSCLDSWTPFAPSTIQVSPPLLASDFNTITRDDGTTQITFRGRPLYYYIEDSAPGDTLGYGIDGAWYVMSATGS